MRVTFKGTLHFSPPHTEWWRDPTRMREVFAALDRAGLSFGMHHASKETGKLSPKKDLVAWSTRWKSDTGYVVCAGREPSPQTTELRLVPEREWLAVRLTIAAADAESRRATLIDSFVAFARDLHERIGAGQWHVDGDLESDYTRPGPPRSAGNWPVGVFLMIVDPDAILDIEDDREAATRDLERVTNASLPRGATREQVDDLTVLRFVHDLTDEPAVNRARAAQDQWITSIVASEIGAFWNAQGDEIVLLVAAAPHPPLTLYDSSHRHGYKAMFEADDAALDEAAGWLRAKQLPDGTPLAGMSIVLTTRDGALQAADRVRARGMRLLYTDTKGRFWEPPRSGPA